MRWILVLLVALVLAGCGLGKEGGGTAADAAEDVVRMLAAGQYAEAWQRLHPAHQAIVSQQLYVDCGRQLEQQRDPKVRDLKVLHVTDQRVAVPEVGEVDAKLVDLEWRQGEDLRRPTYTMVQVEGEWRWVLSDRALGFFKDGQCPQ